jgi:hypothetical protein
LVVLAPATVWLLVVVLAFTAGALALRARFAARYRGV